MSENKECLFYIDHNPPECSGTWGGAIYKGACKINSTSCNDTDKCFIKLLYQQVEQKEQEYEDYKIANAEFEKENNDLRNKLQAKEHELIMTKADLCRGCQYRNDYKNLFKTHKSKEQELQEAMDNYVQLDLQRVKEYNELVDLYKAKEQECEELIGQRDKLEFGNNILEHERNRYKHALDNIEHQVTELFLGVENKDRTYCEKILDIINSVKDKNVPHKAKEGE